jgi:hypothetical protein
VVKNKKERKKERRNTLALITVLPSCEVLYTEDRVQAAFRREKMHFFNPTD